jgi:nucleotide-binding universal stress UspA family protein
VHAEDLAEAQRLVDQLVEGMASDDAVAQIWADWGTDLVVIVVAGNSGSIWRSGAIGR